MKSGNRNAAAFFLYCIVASASPLHAQSPAPVALPEEQQTTGLSRMAYQGDLRASLGSNKRRERDRTNETVVMPTLRFRNGTALPLTEHLVFEARLAGLFNKDTKGIDFRLQNPVSTGDIALDSLFLSYSPTDSITFDMGRIQTAFELDSVVEDSLSRHDSSGTAVDWTNGMHLKIGEEDSARLHFIGQRNRKSGTTNAIATGGPLSFDDKNSRLTYYLGLELPPSGIFTQLIADVTVIPEALRPLGVENEKKSTIIAATVKAAADVTIGSMTIHPFMELGSMLSDTHKEAGVTPRTNESAGRWALVTGLDILDVGPGDLGIQAAWVESGFIISPDYPANAYSLEFRHRTELGENAVFDIRYRFREDLERNAFPATRIDRNLQIRLTVEF